MNVRLRVILAVSLLAVLGAACQPHSFKATILEPAKPVDDFSIPSSDGGTFRLSEHKDRFVVVFFGYTHCPDICPATLTQIQQMIQKLGPDADKVDVVFITVDSERDTLDALKTYLAHFNPTFAGLRTDDADQLKTLGQQFGIYYELGTTDEHTSDYLVMHTSSVLILHQMGLKAVFPPDTSGADMAADLREIVKN